ncbi:MAG TPA: sigma-70 family RNA polymerase sigma factor [Steroidobacteraceae bacterium]
MTDSGRGDPAEERLARVLESYRPDLMRFAFWLTRDPGSAEDIVQETLLRAWRARAALRDSTAVRSWLLTIARRESARLHERKRPQTVDVDECLARQDVELAFHDEDPEIGELRGAILGLPNEYREPLVLQVLGGFTTGEIAAELNLSVAAVLTRLFRARNKLRERYATASATGSAPVAGAP